MNGGGSIERPRWRIAAFVVGSIALALLGFGDSAVATTVSLPLPVGIRAQLSQSDRRTANVDWEATPEEYVSANNLGTLTSQGVRWRTDSGNWSNWIEVDATHRLTIPRAKLGQSVELDGKNTVVSDSGRSTKLIWSGGGTIIPAPSCEVPDAFFSIMSGVTEADAVAFSTPVTADELTQAAENSGVKIAEVMREDTFANGTTYTSGLTIDQSEDLGANLEDAGAEIAEELGDHVVANTEDAVTASNSDESSDSDVEVLRQEAEGARQLQSTMILERSLSVTQIAFAHDDSAMARLLAYFGSRVSDAFSMDGAASCKAEGDSGVPAETLLGINPNADDAMSEEVQNDDSLPTDASSPVPSEENLETTGSDERSVGQVGDMTALELQSASAKADYRTYTPKKINLAGVNGVKVKTDTKFGTMYMRK